MAKNRSTHFRVSGTLDGVTYVKTRNGEFVRMPRGTYTAVDINDTLKTVSSRTAIINAAGKLVHDAIKSYARNFKKSNLWQDILGRIRTAKADDLTSLLRTLEGLELHPVNTLKKIMPALKVGFEHSSGIATLSLMSGYLPEFTLPDEPDCYYYELFILFVDDENEPIGTEKINTGWISMQQPRLHLEMSFEPPVTTKYYVVMMKAQGGIEEKEIEDFRAMGVRVMKVGEV